MAGKKGHVLYVRSTKPGRKLIRKEKCYCDKGDAHTKFESPDKK